MSNLVEAFCKQEEVFALRWALKAIGKNDSVSRTRYVYITDDAILCSDGFRAHMYTYPVDSKMNRKNKALPVGTWSVRLIKGASVILQDASQELGNDNTKKFHEAIKKLFVATSFKTMPANQAGMYLFKCSFNGLYIFEAVMGFPKASFTFGGDMVSIKLSDFDYSGTFQALIMGIFDSDYGSSWLEFVKDLEEKK